MGESGVFQQGILGRAARDQIKMRVERNQKGICGGVQTPRLNQKEGKKKSHSLRISRSLHFYSLMQADATASISALQGRLVPANIHSQSWAGSPKGVRRGRFLDHPFKSWTRDHAPCSHHPKLRKVCVTLCSLPGCGSKATRSSQVMCHACFRNDNLSFSRILKTIQSI